MSGSLYWLVAEMKEKGGPEQFGNTEAALPWKHMKLQCKCAGKGPCTHYIFKNCCSVCVKENWPNKLATEAKCNPLFLFPLGSFCNQILFSSWNFVLKLIYVVAKLFFFASDWILVPILVDKFWELEIFPEHVSVYITCIWTFLAIKLLLIQQCQYRCTASLLTRLHLHLSGYKRNEAFPSLVFFLTS